MERSSFGQDTLIAVSANAQETAINTYQTLDTGMLCDIKNRPDLEAQREDDRGEATGKEEANRIYDLGNRSGKVLSFPKMQIQHLAFAAAYVLGNCESADVGVDGRIHTIQPIQGDLDAARSNPSFTAAVRSGINLEKRRFASMFGDGLKLSLKKDSWAQLDLNVAGTGKHESNALKDTITAAWNATTLALTKAIAGADAANRLANVHQVRALDPVGGQWVDVVCTEASGATPCVLAITAPGEAATSTTYEVIYNQKEADPYDWCVFPNRVEEDPIRVSDFLIKLGGKWDGSALTGGHQMSAEINSLEWSAQNGLKPASAPGSGTYKYANQGLRSGRTQTITIERRFLDLILAQRFFDVEYFTLYAKAVGESYESGRYYTGEIIWPRVAVKGRPVSVGDGNRNVEGVQLDVYQDDIYGSVIVKCENMVTTYAA